MGLYSLSGKTSYRKISWSLEAARFGFKLLQWLWNLAGTSAALLPMCLSNFRAIRPLQHPISRLRDFTRFGGKTSYRLVNRGPELQGLSKYTRNKPHSQFNTFRARRNGQHFCIRHIWKKMIAFFMKFHWSLFREVLVQSAMALTMLDKEILIYRLPALWKVQHIFFGLKWFSTSGVKFISCLPYAGRRWIPLKKGQ